MSPFNPSPQSFDYHRVGDWKANGPNESRPLERGRSNSDAAVNYRT